MMCARCATLLLIILVMPVPARAASRNRLNFPRKFWNLKMGGGIAMETPVRLAVGMKDVVQERRSVWRDLEHKDPPLSNSHPHFDHTQALDPEKRTRGSCHALFGSQYHTHGQLIRVGCVLGTCQVQNLSYRLYQLIGQRNKDHTSLVNPRSPFSYG